MLLEDQHVINEILQQLDNAFQLSLDVLKESAKDPFVFEARKLAYREFHLDTFDWSVANAVRKCTKIYFIEELYHVATQQQRPWLVAAYVISRFKFISDPFNDFILHQIAGYLKDITLPEHPKFDWDFSNCSCRSTESLADHYFDEISLGLNCTLPNALRDDLRRMFACFLEQVSHFKRVTPPGASREILFCKAWIEEFRNRHDHQFNLGDVISEMGSQVCKSHKDYERDLSPERK